MNQVHSPQCPHCGRNLSTDDLRGQNCPSCGTALPHHARAAQQVALVNQIMAQHTGQPLKRIQEDTERDYIMGPDQGKEYGIIDDVIRKRA